MSALLLDTNYTSGSYSTDLLNFLMPEENSTLANPKSTPAQISAYLLPEFDGGSSIAIGYGLDLLNNSIATIDTWLSAANLTLSATDISLINQAKADTSEGNLKLIASQMQLVLPSESAAETILQAILVDKEAGLTQLLSNNGITIGDSLERIALMSLFYNSNGGVANINTTGVKHNNIIGPALLTALQTGNRAEAWYEICYDTNPNSLAAHPPADAQGIANRRYKESDEFGLYDPGAVTQPEALQVYQMYTRHSAAMIKYDTLYGGGTADTAVALQDAANVLDGIYGINFNDLNIYATSAPSSVVITGSTINRSTDTGADLLIGGAGNDLLIGGSGSDTFAYMPPASGATTETINDYFGNGAGSVYVGNTQLTGGTAVAGKDNTWTDGNGDQYAWNTSTGALTISQGLLGANSGDQIVIDNFNLNAAETNPHGYLGIKFGEQLAAAASASTADDPFSNGGTYTPATQSATVADGNVQTVTLYASTVSDTDQTVTVTGGSASAFISTGANLLAFNGTLNLIIPAGQRVIVKCCV